MIILEDIALRRGQKLLFSGASATLQPGQKIALIGGNGCGKSSLFALLLDELQADAGDIRGLKGLRISHMAQETETSDLTARDYVIAGDAALFQTLQDLARADSAGDYEQSAALHQRMGELDGYSAERRAEQLLLGLGFQRERMDAPMSAFSGGWRIRLNLARALMAPSDLMLLDELNIVLRYDYLPLDEVVAFLAERPEDLHVVVTGRNAKDPLIEAADLVTEMTMVKHPFRSGVKAQQGIEF